MKTGQMDGQNFHYEKCTSHICLTPSILLSCKTARHVMVLRRHAEWAADVGGYLVPRVRLGGLAVLSSSAFPPSCLFSELGSPCHTSCIYPGAARGADGSRDITVCFRIQPHTPQKPNAVRAWLRKVCPLECRPWGESACSLGVCSVSLWDPLP